MESYITGERNYSSAVPTPLTECTPPTLPSSVIFVINLILTIMIVAAPPGLQNITAQYVSSSLEL